MTSVKKEIHNLYRRHTVDVRDTPWDVVCFLETTRLPTSGEYRFFRYFVPKGNSLHISRIVKTASLTNYPPGAWFTSPLANPLQLYEDWIIRVTVNGGMPLVQGLIDRNGIIQQEGFIVNSQNIEKDSQPDPEAFLIIAREGSAVEAWATIVPPITSLPVVRPVIRMRGFLRAHT